MTNQPHDKEKEDAFVFNWYRFFKVLALVVYAVLLISMLAGDRNRDWDDTLIIFFIFSSTFLGSAYALNKLLNHAARYICAGDIYLKEKWRPILFTALWGVPCILFMLSVLSEYLTFFNAYPYPRR